MRSTVLALLPLTLLAAAPLAAAETVQVPQFDSFQLRGGGTVIVRPGPVQRVTIVNGSSQVTTMHVNAQRQLRINACNNRCPQNYNLRIEIQSPTAPGSAIHGGGLIQVLSGFRPQARYSAAIHGGGRIDARALSASRVSAAISGGGRISTGQSRSLSAAINGGGEVTYAGDPETSVAINGGGRVHRAD